MSKLHRQGVSKMDKSLLHHLFEGEINPSEIIGIHNDELLQANELRGNETIALFKKLPNITRADIERMEELADKAHGIYSRECFIYGFKLGALLIMEVLAGKDDLVRKKSE